jgi:5-amino-6-(5-phosphoribosylamino)uracil reductase
MSLDGYLDDASDHRLMVSSPEDFAEVDKLRASVDAILIGAETLRRDNPALTIKDKALSDARVAAGKPPHPIKVVLTRSGDLEPEARFFTEGPSAKIVACPARQAASLQNMLPLAHIVPVNDPLTAQAVLEALQPWRIGSLLVEGGSRIHTLFLAEGMVNELRVAVAPFFVGDADAPRLCLDAVYPHGPSNRMRLKSVDRLGDTSVMTFLLDRVRPSIAN